MPDPSLNPTPGFFPDIPATDPNEEAQAQHRAATLGLLATGLGILSQTRRRGEPSIVPIARGASVGLETYQDSLQQAATNLMNQRKIQLDAYKERVAEERAESYMKHQQIIEEQAGAREKTLDAVEAERERQDRAKNTATDAAQATRDAAQETRDAAEREHERVDTERFDPVGAGSPLTQRFDRYRIAIGICPTCPDFRSTSMQTIRPRTWRV
jgi:hypothetical protein